MHCICVTEHGALPVLHRGQVLPERHPHAVLPRAAAGGGRIHHLGPLPPARPCIPGAPASTVIVFGREIGLKSFIIFSTYSNNYFFHNNFLASKCCWQTINKNLAKCLLSKDRGREGKTTSVEGNKMKIKASLSNFCSEHIVEKKMCYSVTFSF